MFRGMGGYLRRHHVGLLALFMAMSGTAYAATLPRNSVGTAQLKANAVTSAKVKNGTLKRADFARGQLPPSLAGPKGATGATGAAGAPGAQGPEGPPGFDGSALAAGVAFPVVGPGIGFIGNTNFGFTAVTPNATGGIGHYCVTLTPGLAQFSGLLAINVSAIRTPGLSGIPIAYQEASNLTTCPALQIGIVTEIITGATPGASNDVAFAITGN